MHTTIIRKPLVLPAMMMMMTLLMFLVLSSTPRGVLGHSSFHPNAVSPAAKKNSIISAKTIAIFPRGGGGGAASTKTKKVAGKKVSVTPKKNLAKATPAATPPTLSLSSFPYWNIIGNIFNIASLISVLYMGYNLSTTDVSKGDYGTPPFSKQFLVDGFCIKNRFDIWKSSHAACFYADMILSVILFQLMKLYQTAISNRGMDTEYLKPAVPISTIVHGVGHLLISVLDHQSGGNVVPPGKVAVAITTVIYFVVFYALFVASSPTMSSSTAYSQKHDTNKALTYSINIGAFLCALIAALIWDTNDQFHSIQLGFTFVHAITITYAAIVQVFVLPKEKKTLAYAAWAGLVTLMVNIVGWWVALDCQMDVFGTKKTLLALWGHLWYDSYVAISYILFLLFGLKFLPLIHKE